MTMCITRGTIVAALLALSSISAAAQTPADSTPLPAIDVQIARPVAVADSLRAPAMHTRRAWDVQGGGTGRRTARGAIIGGAVGAVLGGIAGAVIGNGFCDAADCSDSARDGALAGGALVGLTGAAIGALIGFVW
jgi:hypothetical protein